MSWERVGRRAANNSFESDMDERRLPRPCELLNELTGSSCPGDGASGCSGARIAARVVFVTWRELE